MFGQMLVYIRCRSEWKTNAISLEATCIKDVLKETSNLPTNTQSPTTYSSLNRLEIRADTVMRALDDMEAIDNIR